MNIQPPTAIDLVCYGCLCVGFIFFALWTLSVLQGKILTYGKFGFDKIPFSSEKGLYLGEDVRWKS